jgi:hypothetical protein
MSLLVVVAVAGGIVWGFEMRRRVLFCRQRVSSLRTDEELCLEMVAKSEEALDAARGYLDTLSSDSQPTGGSPDSKGHEEFEEVTAACERFEKNIVKYRAKAAWYGRLRKVHESTLARPWNAVPVEPSRPGNL